MTLPREIFDSKDCHKLFQHICPNQSVDEWNKTFASPAWCNVYMEGRRYDQALCSETYQLFRDESSLHEKTVHNCRIILKKLREAMPTAMNIGSDMYQLFIFLCPNGTEAEWDATLGNNSWSQRLINRDSPFSFAKNSQAFSDFKFYKSITVSTESQQHRFFKDIWLALLKQNNIKEEQPMNHKPLDTQGLFPKTEPKTFFSKVQEGFAWLITQLKDFITKPFETFGKIIDSIKGLFKKINILAFIKKIKQFLIVALKKPKVITVFLASVLGKDTILSSLASVLDLSLKALKKILPAALYNKIDLFISRIVGFVYKIFEGVWNTKPIAWIRKMVGKLLTIFGNVKRKAIQWVRDVMNKLLNDKIEAVV